MTSSWRDQYPTDLDHEADRDEAVDADAGIYRRFLRRMDVRGLPERVQAGDVSVSFIAGPVRTQRTLLRQRPGLPFVFDKHMARAMRVGEGELLTALELPVSLDDGFPVDAWRSRIDAAIGFVVACVDERVAGEQIAEDIILLREGEPVAAAEQVALVRSFMPFEVGPATRKALAGLEELSLSEDQPLVRASALYAQASRQGPSRLGFLLMWLSVDALVYEGRNQVKELRAALRGAGVVEAWLSQPVRRLAALRGSVAHGKAHSEQRVFDGYYDMEAIARALIASRGNLRKAWPASPTVTAFRPYVAAAMGPAASAYEEVWHDERLPPACKVSVDTPFPETGDAVRDGHAEWIHISGDTAPLDLGQLRWAVWQALTALALDAGDVEITVSDDHEYGLGSGFLVTAQRLLLSPSHPTAFGPNQSPELVVELCGLFGQQQAMRLGIAPTTTLGVFLVELIGTAALRFAFSAEPDQALLDPVTDGTASLPLVGQCLGFAVGGDSAAASALDGWDKNAADSGQRSLVADARSALSASSFDGLLLALTSWLTSLASS